MAAAVDVQRRLLAALFLTIISIVSADRYIESIAANVDSPAAKPGRKHEHFVPLVAFQCGYRNKFMNKQGEWQDDPSSVAGCLQGKYDILKYCKRVYPDEQVTNIVEYSHVSHIDNWCKEDGSDCHSQFVVRPFRCIAGEFVTESLQVPNRCHFSHIAGKNKCNDYKFWNSEADSQCAQKKEEASNQPMRLRSFAILEPCGLSMFRGVEYVCCPKSVEEKIEKVVDLDKDADDDDYSDDEDDDDEEEEDSKAKGGKAVEDQDPYFKEDSTANEHDRFRDAEERLEKKHRKKVTKVITEWSELFERYNKMKEKDPKGAEDYKREMTAKFRKTVSALEEENKEQRKQIEEVHDERVQTSLNEKKRQATHDYRSTLAVQVGSTNKKNVLKTLKSYIKAEEKDRTHMLNRYRHLLRSDPEAAVQFEPVLMHRLRYIDLRINGTLAMLRDFPELEKVIRPIAIKFWMDYRRDNTPEGVDQDDKSGNFLTEDERNDRLIRLYKKTFERNHPGVQLQFIDKTKTAPTTPHSLHAASIKGSTPKPHVVVALKDVLSEKDDSEAEEDSDEDQFEEDDDDSSVTSATHSPKTKLALKGSEAKTAKIHVELLKTEDKSSELKLTKDEEELKAKIVVPILKKKEKSSDNADTEDDDDEDDESDEAESEYVETNDKKATDDVGTKSKLSLDSRELNVAVEPLILAPREEFDEASSASLKHRLSLTEVETRERTYLGHWISNTNLMIVVLASLLIVILIALTFRRRTRHPGFVEVDICTPEEKHVSGMQANGYENPTYTFYETKP